MFKNLLPDNLSSTVILIISFTIVGCSSDGEERPQYLDANSVRALEIPPKLTSPDTQGALRLPEPSEKARSGESTVIAPVFTGFELKNDSRLYWLEIDKPVAEVWASLPGFLSSEGIEVDRVEELLGFIDTSWMSEYQVTYNSQGSSSWFSGFSPDYKDRFRIRVEAGQRKNMTRMFINHRGLQISVANDITEWVQRDSEPFLEREILYRYVLFSGINKSGATELLASYNSYQPRINKVDETASEFDVKGDAETIWMRLQVAMDRLGVDIVKSNRETASLTVKVGNLKLTEQPAEDKSGWFSGLFSGKDVVVDEDEGFESSEYKEKQLEIAPEDMMVLKLKQIAGVSASKIKISQADGSDIKETQAFEFRDALLRQMK
ncbi:MAG: outer membrane protein assembly factor BamC [Gammaproteobacteria bacterium]|nr:outer membrane protein assembly factor BamC [Gammaproteobacteria bacterium]